MNVFADAYLRGFVKREHLDYVWTTRVEGSKEIADAVIV